MFCDTDNSSDKLNTGEKNYIQENEALGNRLSVDGKKN